MVKIKYEKMKSIDPNVTILTEHLLGSDIDYLKEIYKSDIKDYMNDLAIHPYISPYLRNSCSDAEEYGPDECLSRNLISKFWCFRYSIEQMILQMDESKSI